MADTINILCICGSLRKGSYNAALARASIKLVPPGMVISPSRSIGDFPLYNHDVQASSGFPAPANELAAEMWAADGILICTPEYNWSIPGVLKNAIDWVSRMKDQPFAGKPVVLQSASGGLLGGSRAQYHLRQSLTSLDPYLFGRPEVIVTFATQKFDEATLELKDQSTIDLIKQQLAMFEKFARRMIGK